MISQTISCDSQKGANAAVESDVKENSIDECAQQGS